MIRTDSGPGTNTSSSIVTVPPVPAQGCPATRTDAWRDVGTEHAATVVGNETWTAEGSPHRLPHGITIATGASITLVPCALVLGAHGTAMNVASGGALFAMGEVRRPIRIAAGGDDVAAGTWQGVVLAHGSRSTTRIVHTHVEGAGLEIAVPEADLEHVVINRARGAGVHITSGGSFASYALDVRVDATAATNRDDGTPIHFDDADAVGSLPTGDFHDNARNVILIGASDASVSVRHTQTWRDTGVPYALDGPHTLHIDDAAAPQLTLAPGVVMELGQDGSIVVGEASHAALTIDASAQNAVRLRARQGETWRGIDLGTQTDRAHTQFHGLAIDGAIGLTLDARICVPREITNAVLIARFEPRTDLLADVSALSLPQNTAFVARAWQGANVDLAATTAQISLPARTNICVQTPVRALDQHCPRVAECSR